MTEKKQPYVIKDGFRRGWDIDSAFDNWPLKQQPVNIESDQVKKFNERLDKTTAIKERQGN